jgi:hypothetical protein
MFQLHDKTRRRICLAGFFLFCVLPTLGTAAWCAMRHLPWVAQEEAKTLGRRLGLEVRVAALKYLRPGAVLYEDFELADPETDQRLLHCRLLEIQWKTVADGHGGGKPALVLSASQPEIEISGLRQLGGLLERVMQGQTGRPAVDLRISAGELTLRAGRNSQTLTCLEGSLDNPPGGVQAIAAFRLAGMDMPEPVKIRMVRNRQTNPPASGFEISTGSGELPCDLLAAGLPELGGLGSSCRFRGYLWANQEPGERLFDNWSGEFAGQLLGVDLDRLVGDHFSHKLSGTADISIQTARFRRGRLTEARGALVAGPGVVGRSLLLAAVKNMNFTSGVDLNSLGELVPYDRIALEMFIDGRGLRITGQCPSERIGAIMTTGRQVCLLSSLGAQAQPVAAFIRTLSPDSAIELPAADQTDWLVTHLPMPKTEAPQTREAALPSAQLHLRKE